MPVRSSLPARSAYRSMSIRTPLVRSGRMDRMCLLGDERLEAVAGHVVVDLGGRRLHEVLARRVDRAADAPVERQLGAAHRVDDDAGGVGRVVHLELELDGE